MFPVTIQKRNGVGDYHIIHFILIIIIIIIINIIIIVIIIFRCEFHACFMLIGSWKDRKNLRVGIYLIENL